MYYLFMCLPQYSQTKQKQQQKRAPSLTCMYLFKINANTRAFSCVIMCYVCFELRSWFYLDIFGWWQLICVPRIPFFAHFTIFFFVFTFPSSFVSSIFYSFSGEREKEVKRRSSLLSLRRMIWYAFIWYAPFTYKPTNKLTKQKKNMKENRAQNEWKAGCMMAVFFDVCRYVFITYRHKIWRSLCRSKSL